MQCSVVADVQEVVTQEPPVANADGVVSLLSKLSPAIVTKFWVVTGWFACLMTVITAPADAGVGALQTKRNSAYA
jgi:hypothetical protein